MRKPIFKAVTVERLFGPSLRARATGAESRADSDAREIAEQQRLSQKWQRGWDRSNAVAGRALGDGEDLEPVQAGVYLAEDECGNWLGPTFTDAWYARFQWWKPLHSLAWLRTRITRRYVMVESAENGYPGGWA